MIDKDTIKTVIEVYQPQIVDLLGPAFKEIGKGLGNFFKCAFFPVNILGVGITKCLKLFEKDAAEEINKIPIEKLCEPELNKVGPILEAAKYYVENEEIRKMFAKLLASSMNTDFRKYSHVYLVETLKQLSPLDAKILKYLSKHDCILGKDHAIYVDEDSTIGKIDANKYFPVFISSEMWLNHFIDDETFKNYKMIDMCHSLDNLSRLKLITIADHEINFKKTILSKSHIEKYILDNIGTAFVCNKFKFDDHFSLFDWKFTLHGLVLIELCI